MEEVVLVVDDFDTKSFAYYYCRICHEAELESCSRLEAPCDCTGTVKFAHRDCIQRWCDEKGNTTCEICLKKYEGGYTAIPKQPKKASSLEEVINIRERLLEIERREEEVGNQDILAETECSSILDRGVSYCKTVAILITAFLLVRHLLEALRGEAHYPFSPATVIILKSCGVIIPMCIIIRTISALQTSIRRSGNIHDALIRYHNYDEAGDEEQAVQR